MKIQIRTKKEILNNLAALAALGFCLLGGYLLYLAGAWFLSWAFPSSLLEGLEVGLKTALFAAVLYWLFINSWVKIQLKGRK